MLLSQSQFSHVFRGHKDCVVAWTPTYTEEGKTKYRHKLESRLFWRSSFGLACDHHDGVLFVTQDSGVRILGGANCPRLVSSSNSQATGGFTSEEDPKMPHIEASCLAHTGHDEAIISGGRLPPEIWPPGPHSQVWRLDSRSRGWERLPQMPEPRMHHACEVISQDTGLTYLVAGGWSPALPWQRGGGHALSSCHALSLDTGAWRALPPMSTGRALFSLVNLDSGGGVTAESLTCI